MAEKKLPNKHKLVDEDEESPMPPRVQHLIEKYNRLGLITQQQQQQQQQQRKHQSPSMSNLNNHQRGPVEAPRRFGSAMAIGAAGSGESTQTNQRSAASAKPTKGAACNVKRRSSFTDGLLKLGRRISTALRPGESTNNSHAEPTSPAMSASAKSSSGRNKTLKPTGKEPIKANHNIFNTADCDRNQTARQASVSRLPTVSTPQTRGPMPSSAADAALSQTTTTKSTRRRTVV